MANSILFRVFHQQFSLAIPKYRRLLFPCILVALLFNLSTRETTIAVLSDAFWQVSVFVAMTLAVYHVFANKLQRYLNQFKGRSRSTSEVVIASLLGCLPGCGGAIVIITQYVSGRMSFGSCVAVLTATMGDAAFLLIAAQPMTGIFVAVVGCVTGIVTGLIVNAIHDNNFLRTTKLEENLPQCSGHEKNADVDDAKIHLNVVIQTKFWQALVVPGATIGLLVASQVDISPLFFGESNFNNIGALLAFFSIALWAVNREVTNYQSIVAEDFKAKANKAFQKVAMDTNFITAWVVAAFLLFELAVLITGFDISQLFVGGGAFVPLIAVLVGMVPGCGPQIITTSLYLSGAIPLSAQLGNAISNDGDALFPAIALSPKVALFATLYSSIPALLVSYFYFYFYFFE